MNTEEYKKPEVESAELLKREMEQRLNTLNLQTGYLHLPPSQPESLPGLIEAVGCHYVAYNGRHLAAMVIGHDGSKSYSDADLVVFTNMENVNGVKNFGTQFHQDVKYSQEPKPGTYHFIEGSIAEYNAKPEAI